MASGPFARSGTRTSADAESRVTRAFAHDRFTYPLPEGHGFPLGRYRMLREAIEQQGIAGVVEAPGATDDDLLLAHDPRYLERVVTGRLSDREVKAVGLPWSGCKTGPTRAILCLG